MVRKAQRGSQEAVRRALERELRDPVRQGLWDWLVDESYVRAVITGDDTVTDLARTYRGLVRAADDKASVPPEDDRPRVALPPDQRLDVLSDLVAERMVRDPNVADFRTRLLGDRLLTLEGATRWIHEQHERDGGDTGTIWVAEFPAIVAPETDRGTWGAEPTARVRVPHSDYLEYHQVMPWLREDGGQEVIPSSIPTVIGGGLDELRRLADYVADRTTWSARDACTFVLTGIVPPMPRASGDLVRRECDGLDVSYIEFRVRPSVSA